MSQSTRVTIIGLTILALSSASSASAENDKANAIAGAIAVAVTTGVICTTLAVGDHAEEDRQKPYARRGAMIALGANAAVGPLGESKELANASYGLHGRVGYRCSPRLAGEYEVEWLGGYEPVGGVDLKPLAATSNLRVFVLTGRFQPYVTLGGGILRVAPDGGSSAIALRAGGGLDFYLTKSIVLNGKLDYVAAFNSLDDVDYLTLGLAVGYRF